MEQEYHHRVHSETKQAPLDRWLDGPSVGRPCPSSDELRRAFRMEVTRKQRKSDGTLTYNGVRYEVPSAYRTLERLTLRVARWDVSTIELVDPHRGTHLATLLPLDKEKNAESGRRALPSPNASVHGAVSAEPCAVGVAPLLQKLMADYAADGLPPGFITSDYSCSNPDSDDDINNT